MPSKNLILNGTDPFPAEYYECGILRWLLPRIPDYGLSWPALFFYEHEADSDALEPCDQGAYIPSKVEWDELRRRVDLFYENASAAVIAHHNLELNRSRGLLPAPVLPPKPEKPRILIPGHVYILSAENARYKIGRAKTLAARLKALHTASPLSFTLAHAIQSGDTVRAESLLHKRFADKRAHGEWFDLSPDDVTWLTSLQDFQLDGEIAA